MEPLDEAQSRILAEQTLQSYKRTYTANAMEQILQMAGGDHYLIPLLCQFCYDLSQGYTCPTIT
ncbi:MAG: hypothetical protein R2867_00245 [Caldilineaceae bacterium]